MKTKHNVILWTSYIAITLLIGVGFGRICICEAMDRPPSFANIAKKAGPGVVNILAFKLITTDSRELNQVGQDDPFRDYFDRFFKDRMPKEYRQAFWGSGFIIDQAGLVLTNNHVVENTTELKVRLANGREFKAGIVGQDPKTDLALIRIESDQPVASLPLGDSESLEVGDWIVAIGNPFGFGNTVTSGIVSAKYRQIGAGGYDNFIQTDASINPGNSGGPLLNMAGEVVGINSAIFSQLGGSLGIGFAIPINLAKSLLPQLRQGKVKRSFLGVMLQDITPLLKQKLNLGTDIGALVSDIFPGGPAEKAGLQRGDAIISFDGKTIRNSHDLPQIVAATPIGKKVELVVARKEKHLTLYATTEEMKEAEKTSETLEEEPLLGLVLQAITPELAQKYSLPRNRGLLILEVEEGSAADEADLTSGDIIIEVEGKPISDITTFNRTAAPYLRGGTLLLLVDRNGGTVYVTLSIS